MPVTPATRLSPYEILSLIGSGGMGEVYRARDTRVNREVAVKLLGEGSRRTARVLLTQSPNPSRTSGCSKASRSLAGSENDRAAVIAQKGGHLNTLTARTLMILMFLSALSRPAPEATELQPEKPQEASLKAGQANSYQLSLQSGDYSEVKVDLHGIEVIVTVHSSDGNKVRAAKLGPEEQGSVGFVAGSAGGYRVEVAATGKGGEGRYTITLTKIVAVSQRLARAPVPPVESRRIKALRAALDAGEPNAVSAFWEEIKTKGAPWIEKLEGEKLEGDARNMLVTFLWRGDAETRNVAVL